jgi:hypothetical protein
MMQRAGGASIRPVEDAQDFGHPLLSFGCGLRTFHVAYPAGAVI